MPVIATEKKFEELRAELAYQKNLFDQWDQIAQTANQATPSTKLAQKKFQHAYSVHIIGNLKDYAPQNRDISLDEKAFALLMIAIEVAPPEAQREALKNLLSPLHPIIEQQEDEKAVFYKNMVRSLGPRLDASNQSIVLQWVFEYDMTKILPLADDGLDIIEFNEDSPYPNEYLQGYTDESKAELANKILNNLVDDDCYTLSPAVSSWVTSLLPASHPRFVGQCKTPVAGGWDHHSIWVMPAKTGEEHLLFVDDENPLNSKNLPDLMTEFKQNVKAKGVSADGRRATVNAVQKLTSLFLERAEESEEYPSLQIILLTSANHLRGLNIAG